MGKFKDYKVGTRFISEGRIVKVVSNLDLNRDCSDCVFDLLNRKGGCYNYACSYRTFKLSRLNKLIFWKKKINKNEKR